MKRIMVVASVMIMAALLTCVFFSQVKAQSPTIVLQDFPPGGLLELTVGESVTFDVIITSDEPFILAIAMTDAYYPGRYIDCHGNDRAIQDTDAELHLTMTGRSPTAELPGEVVPVTIAAGVRYKGGVVFSQRWDFNVLVEP